MLVQSLTAHRAYTRARPATPAPALEDAVKALTSLDDPHHLWTFAVDGSIGSVACIGPGNTLFVGTDDKKLYAVDLKTGQKKWHFETRNWVRGGALLGQKNQLYVGGDDTNFYALDQQSGQKLWATSLGGSIRSTPSQAPDGTLYASSVAYEFRERGVATSVGQVFALDPDTGAVKWRSRKLDGSVENEASPVPGPDNTVLIAGENKLIALDATNGEERWSVDLNGRGGTPIVGPDGTIYASSNGWKQKDVHSVMAIKDGQVLWDFHPESIGSCIPDLSLADGKLFVGDWGKTVYALDAQTGIPRWQVQPGSYGAFSPTARDGTVYVAGGRDNKLYALDAETGATRWTFNSSGELWRSPTVTDEGILVGSRDGQLHALTGTLDLAKDTDRPAVVEGSGYVLVGGVHVRKRKV